MKKIILTVILVILILLNMAFIFNNSHKTAEQSTAISKELAATITAKSRADEAAPAVDGKFHSNLRQYSHAVEFFPLGLFVMLLLCLHVKGGVKNRLSMLISFVFVLLYALSDEWHQIFLDGRAFEFHDILIDCVGGIMGIILAVLTASAAGCIFKKSG